MGGNRQYVRNVLQRENPLKSSFPGSMPSQVKIINGFIYHAVNPNVYKGLQAKICKYAVEK